MEMSYQARRVKACRTRELSAELTVTREHWRKQVPPVCGKIFGTRDEKLSKSRRTRGDFAYESLLAQQIALVCGSWLKAGFHSGK